MGSGWSFHAKSKTASLIFVFFKLSFGSAFCSADIRYEQLRYANIFLYFWIVLVFGVSILDLGLGIAFGLDYDTLKVGVY